MSDRTVGNGVTKAHLRRAASPCVCLLAMAVTAPAAGQTPPPIGDQAFATLAEFFVYEPGGGARLIERVDTAGGIRERIVFDWDGRSVPAFLSIPNGAAGRLPAVVLVDGLAGTKSRWWQADGWPRGLSLTRALMDAGFVVIALDAPFHGERIAEGGFEDPWSMRQRTGRMRDMLTRTAIEQRRAIDYLATRAEVDTTRIAILGLSMGGVVSHIVAAVDPRVKAVVAGVTPLTWITPALHVANFAPRIRQPILLLMGRTDSYYTPEAAARHLALIASETKELAMYDVGHRLPSEYVGRAVGFLVRELRPSIDRL